MANEARIDRTLLIPTRDGEFLAGTVFLPAGPGPFPALLSMSPYHKEGFDGAHHEFGRLHFAEHGYATVLVDFRGTGGSTGTVMETMDPGEGRDAADVVEWTASQEWCDGNVGMWGISYGGIVSLKAAAEKPEPLKAIAPIMGGLDLYHEYQFPGGCRDFSFAHGTYGNWMAAMNMMPPAIIDPEGRWYDVWMERLKQNRPWMMAYKEHPDYDSYWQSRSVDARSVDTPTFLIGGWRDMFRSAMPSIYSALDCPKRLLMGPWMHAGPDMAPYQPVDYLAELTRWFDRWLKGAENGIDHEPPVVCFIEGAEEWRALPTWPPKPAGLTVFHAASEGVLEPKGDEHAATIPYTVVPSVGVTAGHDWDPGEANIGWPADQGPDDLRSVTFTTEPLAEHLAIVGQPEAHIRVTVVEGADAQLVVRLNDVGPDGSSTLITRGRLSLRHRNSTSSPEPILPGDTYDVHVPLDPTAYRVEAGHQVRIAVSGSDFPRIWPSAVNSTLELHVGGEHGSTVTLPEVAITDWPETSPPVPDQTVNRAPTVLAGGPKYSILHDHVAGTVAVNEGFWLRMALTSGGTVSVDQDVVSRVADAFPESASVEGKTTMQAELPGVGTVEVTTHSRASIPGSVVSGLVTLNGVKVHEEVWNG